MTITRSGQSISVESDWIAVNYTGTMRRTEFSTTGTQPLPGGGGRCADGTSFPQTAGVSTLSGAFSGDDQVFFANEVNTYHLTSGEPVTYTWEWQGTRRN
jgi:hypothetical protein